MTMLIENAGMKKPVSRANDGDLSAWTSAWQTMSPQRMWFATVAYHPLRWFFGDVFPDAGENDDEDNSDEQATCARN